MHRHAAAYDRPHAADGKVHRRRDTAGSAALPAGPAMTTLRSVVAPLASTIRSAGIVYIVVQVVIWHSFYTTDPWRLAAPVMAVAWAAAVIVCLRRRWPSPLLAVRGLRRLRGARALAQGCVPPNVRDDTFSWLVICMSGQLIVPAWYAPGALRRCSTLLSPAAYWLGAAHAAGQRQQDAGRGGVVLFVVGLAHTLARRELYRRAAAADASPGRGRHAAGEQYAVLARNIERREHERLLHDTVLNTLTALARAGAEDPAVVVSRCRQDVALIEDALGDQGDPAADAGRAPGDLVVPGAGRRRRHARPRAHRPPRHRRRGRARRPGPGHGRIANATREALSNVAAHAGTGEAWVQVRLTSRRAMPTPRAVWR